MYELEELNPSVSEATVYKHIQSSSTPVSSRRSL